MNGYWMGFQRNCRCNYGCPGNNMGRNCKGTQADRKPAALKPDQLADIKPAPLKPDQLADIKPAPLKPDQLADIKPAPLKPDQLADIKPTVLKPDQFPKRRETAPGKLSMKSTSLGSLAIPANTAIGSIYHIASVNLRTSCFDRFHMRLSFSCNLITTKAKINLSFQIFKQGNYQPMPVPISCNFAFCRNQESNESNMFSFTACDCDSFRSECCNYSVYAKVTGIVTSGVTSVANSILSATLVEIP